MRRIDPTASTRVCDAGHGLVRIVGAGTQNGGVRPFLFVTDETGGGGRGPQTGGRGAFGIRS